jgi:hypothetical protein
MSHQAASEPPGVGLPTVGKEWRKRGLVLMTTALILAIMVVVLLAFAAQRLIDAQ